LSLQRGVRSWPRRIDCQADCLKPYRGFESYSLRHRSCTSYANRVQYRLKTPNIAAIPEVRPYGRSADFRDFGLETPFFSKASYCGHLVRLSKAAIKGLCSCELVHGLNPCRPRECPTANQPYPSSHTAAPAKQPVHLARPLGYQRTHAFGGLFCIREWPLRGGRGVESRQFPRSLRPSAAKFPFGGSVRQGLSPNDA
jgi:hypothetical protein